MFVIVSYDIVDNKRRSKVSKCMMQFGDRVQFSVFECNVESAEMEKMRLKLKKIINEKDDNIRIYTICSNCKSRIELLGQGRISEDPNLIII